MVQPKSRTSLARVLSMPAASSVRVIPRLDRFRKSKFLQWKRFFMKKSCVCDSQIMEMLKRADAGA
jgi:hypothetical protein